MKCPADLITACDKEPQCNCGFCFEHCCCNEPDPPDVEEYIKGVD